MYTNELLCTVVKTDQCEITEILIKSGADVNYVDKTGKFPLYHAYENKKISQMKILLAHGADINKIYKDYPILNHECSASKSNHEILKMLMDNGADPNIKPVAEFDSHALMKLVLKEDIDNVSILLSYPGTDINLQDNNGRTSFWIACVGCSGELVMLLVNKGADPNIQPNDDKCSALMKSITSGKFSVASVLISRDDVKLNLQDSQGNTALHRACKENAGTIIYQLLIRGADQTLTNKDGKTAFDYCKDGLKWLFKNYEETKKKDIFQVPIVSDAGTSDKQKLILKDILPAPVVSDEGTSADKQKLIKQVVCFHVQNQANIKIGTPGSYYQKWDNTFKCWTNSKLIPTCDNVILKCEYVDKKIPNHTYGAKIIRFSCIYREDGSKMTDLYE